MCLARCKCRSRLILAVNFQAGRLIVLLDLDGLLDLLVGVGHSDIVHAVVLGFVRSIGRDNAFALHLIIGDGEQLVRLVRRLDDLAVLVHRHGLDRQILTICHSLVGHIARRLLVVESDGIAGLNSVDGVVDGGNRVITDEGRLRVGERLARLCLHSEGIEEIGRRALEVAVDGHIHHVVGVSGRYGLRGALGIDLVDAVRSGDCGVGAHLHTVQLIAVQGEDLDFDIRCTHADILGVGIQRRGNAIDNALHRDGDEVSLGLDIVKGDRLGSLDLLCVQGLFQRLAVRQLVIHNAGCRDREALTLLDLEGLRAIGPIRGQIARRYAGQRNRDIVIDGIIDKLCDERRRLVLLRRQLNRRFFIRCQLPAEDFRCADRLLHTVNARDGHGVECIARRLICRRSIQLDRDRRHFRCLVIERHLKVTGRCDVDFLFRRANQRIAARKRRCCDRSIRADRVVFLLGGFDLRTRIGIDLLDRHRPRLVDVGIGNGQRVDTVIHRCRCTVRVRDHCRVAGLAIIHCLKVSASRKDVRGGIALLHRAGLLPDHLGRTVQNGLVGHIAGLLVVVEDDLAVFDDFVSVVNQRAAIILKAVDDRCAVSDLGADFHRGRVLGEAVNRSRSAYVVRLDRDVGHVIFIDKSDLGNPILVLLFSRTLDVGQRNGIAAVRLHRRGDIFLRTVGINDLCTSELVALDAVCCQRILRNRFRVGYLAGVQRAAIRCGLIHAADCNRRQCAVTRRVDDGVLGEILLALDRIALGIQVLVKEVLIERQRNGLVAAHCAFVQLKLRFRVSKQLRVVPRCIGAARDEGNGVIRRHSGIQQFAAVERICVIAVQIPGKAVAAVVDLIARGLQRTVTGLTGVNIFHTYIAVDQKRELAVDVGDRDRIDNTGARSTTSGLIGDFHPVATVFVDRDLKGMFIVRNVLRTGVTLCISRSVAVIKVADVIDSICRSIILIDRSRDRLCKPLYSSDIVRNGCGIHRQSDRLVITTEIDLIVCRGRQREVRADGYLFSAAICLVHCKRLGLGAGNPAFRLRVDVLAFQRVGALRQPELCFAFRIRDGVVDIRGAVRCACHVFHSDLCAGNLSCVIQLSDRQGVEIQGISFCVHRAYTGIQHIARNEIRCGIAFGRSVDHNGSGSAVALDSSLFTAGAAGATGFAALIGNVSIPNACMYIAFRRVGRSVIINIFIGPHGSRSARSASFALVDFAQFSRVINTTLRHAIPVDSGQRAT